MQPVNDLINNSDTPNHTKSIKGVRNVRNGGEKGDRTLDLRLMSPALYQLSYLALFR